MCEHRVCTLHRRRGSEKKFQENFFKTFCLGKREKGEIVSDQWNSVCCLPKHPDFSCSSGRCRYLLNKAVKSSMVLTKGSFSPESDVSKLLDSGVP